MHVVADDMKIYVTGCFIMMCISMIVLVTSGISYHSQATIMVFLI